MAPPHEPIPTTEATARRGNISEAKVKRLADHPWCAAVARLISATAPHKFCTREAIMMGTTASAQISMVVLRARFALHPILRNLAGSQPPKTLPTVAAL